MYRQTNKDIDKQRYRQTEKAIRRHINEGIDTIGNLYTDWEIYLQTNGGIRIQTEKAKGIQRYRYTHRESYRYTDEGIERQRQTGKVIYRQTKGIGRQRKKRKVYADRGR